MTDAELLKTLLNVHEHLKTLDISDAEHALVTKCVCAAQREAEKDVIDQDVLTIRLSNVFDALAIAERSNETKSAANL